MQHSAHDFSHPSSLFPRAAAFFSIDVNPDQQGQYDGGAADKKHKVAIHKPDAILLKGRRVVFPAVSQPIVPHRLRIIALVEHGVSDAAIRQLGF